MIKNKLGYFIFKYGLPERVATHHQKDFPVASVLECRSDFLSSQ